MIKKKIKQLLLFVFFGSIKADSYDFTIYGEAGVGVCDINIINIHRNVSNVVYLCTVVRVISSW